MRKGLNFLPGIIPFRRRQRFAVAAVRAMQVSQWFLLLGLRGFWQRVQSPAARCLSIHLFRRSHAFTESQALIAACNINSPVQFPKWPKRAV